MKESLKNMTYIFLMIAHSLLFAQEHTCKLQLKDAETYLPISNAHISYTCVGDSSTANTTSDLNGFFNASCNESIIINITHLGYENFSQLVQKCTENDELLINPIASNLPEYVITAQHKQTLEKESVYSIEKINLEKINNKGATTINEAINTELNTRLSNRPGWSGTNVNLQGFSGEQINIMVDGVPLNGRLNGNIDLQQVNLNNVEKIEILQGPVSVIYGSNSSGGAINIITSENTSKKFNFKTRGYYESVGQFNVSSNLSIAHKNNFVNVGGGRNYFTGYSLVDSLRNKTWLQREQYYGDFSYKRKFKNMEIKFASNLFFEESKDRGEKRAPDFTSAFDTYYKTQRHINRFFYKWKISDEYVLDLTSAVSIFKRDRIKYFRDLTTLEYINTGDGDTTLQLDFYARPVFSRQKNNAIWNYQVGFEVASSNLKADRIEGNKANMQEYAVFFNSYIYPFKNKRLTINPGIRYIYNNKYKAPLVYALNFNALLGKEFNIRGSVAKGFRTPTIKELYLSFPFSESIQVYGNKNLKAETSNHVRLSSGWQKRVGQHEISMDITFFFNNLNNMITTAQISDTEWKYINVGNFKSLGQNFAISYKNSFSKWNAGFNYTGFMFNPDKENYQSKFYFSPEFVFSSSIKIPVIKVNFDNNIKYNGQLTSQYIGQFGAISKSKIGSYTIWDMSMGRKFWEDRINIIVGIKNLIGVKNIPIQGKVYGYNTAKDATQIPINWGRTGFASLILNF